MRAVIFDLDGTLIDSAPDIAAAVNHVLAAEGFLPLSLAEIRRMIGDGAKTLLDRALAARGVPAEPRHLDAFLAFYNADPVVETVVYEGIPEVLATLRGQGRLLAVCTNKPIIPTRLILDRLGLAASFSAVVGGDSTPYKKPDPRHLAAALAGLEVADAIMVGDHHNDLLAAAGLRLPAIFVRWGYGEADAAHAADAPRSLPGIIAEMG